MILSIRTLTNSLESSSSSSVGSSSNSSIATDMSKDSLNRPRDYYFYDSSSSYAPTGDGDDEYGYPDGSYDDGDGDDGYGKKNNIWVPYMTLKINL